MTMLQTARQVTNDFWLKSAPRFLGSILYLFSADKLFYSFFMFVTTLVLSAAAFIRSKDNFRLLPLLLSSLVTIAFGLIISAVYRPVYLLRYLYPSAIVFCLALCIAVSKTKRKMEYTIILSAITLMVCIPAYINTVKTEKYKDLRCTEACQKVKENIHPGDVVLTNNTFIGWTIFEYYFPDLTCISDVSAGYSDFEEGKNYYLMWKNDISDDEKNWLSGYGFQPEKIMENGSVGETDFQLYRLNKQVQ